MSKYAVANLDDSTTSVAGEDTTALSRFGTALTSVRNRVTNTILDQMLPSTMEDTKPTVGGILEYDGATIMIEPNDERMGLEVRDGDLIFATGDGIWIGTTHFDDMPTELEEYNFITSGTREDYMEMVEQKLENELERHNQVIAFLMAA